MFIPRIQFSVMRRLVSRISSRSRSQKCTNWPGEIDWGKGIIAYIRWRRDRFRQRRNQSRRPVYMMNRLANVFDNLRDAIRFQPENIIPDEINATAVIAPSHFNQSPSMSSDGIDILGLTILAKQYLRPNVHKRLACRSDETSFETKIVLGDVVPLVTKLEKG